MTDVFAPSLLATDAAERTRFVDALREKGTIAGALRVTGVSRSTFERQRRRDLAFDAACAAALGAAGAQMLVTALISRLSRGVARYRSFADGRTDRWREYDNRAALALLAKLDPLRFGDGTMPPPPPPPVMTRAEFLAAIEARPLPPPPPSPPPSPDT